MCSAEEGVAPIVPAHKMLVDDELPATDLQFACDLANKGDDVCGGGGGSGTLSSCAVSTPLHVKDTVFSSNERWLILVSALLHSTLLGGGDNCVVKAKSLVDFRIKCGGTHQQLHW